MPRMRNRSIPKEPLMDDSHFQSFFLSEKRETNSFFNITGILKGLNLKGVSEFDSLKSPTSPLDFRVLSNPGNPFSSSRASIDMQRRSWDCHTVGLSFINSLDDNKREKSLPSSDRKTIVFGSQMRINPLNTKTLMVSLEKPNSLPKNYAAHCGAPVSDVTEAKTFGKSRSCSLDLQAPSLLFSGYTDHSPFISYESIGSEGCINEGNNSNTKPTSNPITIGSSNALIGSLPASEIELSEDYTRVVLHGPNPKTTHIFGDCILEVPSNDFLSCCCCCKKKLEGIDIYMYRGEKAFCSLSCRAKEILIDKEEGKSHKNNPGPVKTLPAHGGSPAGMFIAV